MAALSFNVEQPSRKKRRECSTSDDDMRSSFASNDSWTMSSAGALNRASSTDAFDDGFDDDEIVYRSCGSAMDSCLEAAQRQACGEQMEILSQITTELEADVWSDAVAAAAALARLLELSARLSAAREAYEAAVSEEAAASDGFPGAELEVL